VLDELHVRGRFGSEVSLRGHIQPLTGSWFTLALLDRRSGLQGKTALGPAEFVELPPESRKVGLPGFIVLGKAMITPILPAQNSARRFAMLAGLAVLYTLLALLRLGAITASTSRAEPETEPVCAENQILQY